MFREIKKKQLILENRKPYSNEICNYIYELNMADWIYSSLRLDNCALTRIQIEKILGGNFIPDISLNDHAIVERYRNLYKTFTEMLAMSSSLNKEMLFTFARKLTEDDKISYRKTNPVLVSLNHNPPHPAEIDEQIDLVMHWFYSDDMNTNPILKAVRLHHRIIEVYPFDSCSEAVARAAMYYFLMEKGYHTFELTFSEREYNIAVIEYLKKENLMPFYKAVEISLFNKMEVYMQLTANSP